MKNLHKLGLVTLAVILGGCDSKVDSSVSTTVASFNVAGAPTVEFSVPDMMCPESCAVKVKEILSEQPGAKEVVVDFDAKTATVAVDKDKFDPQAAIAALVDHAFDHSQLKTSAAN
jgi:copper chaperone CopZ